MINSQILMTLIRQPFRSIKMPTNGLPLEAHDPVTAGEQLAAFMRKYPRLFILTGAGISTDSGIPDYRDGEGDWKRRQPVQHQEFMISPEIRRRYWARSLIGWPVMRHSLPNQAHMHLAELEQRAHSTLLVTQNVDRLHQRAGMQQVVDLHGRADRVVCMSCDYGCTRDQVHEHCHDLNPGFRDLTAAAAPDGDADLEVDFSAFKVWDCPKCGGILKPDVVFFGDNVPKTRVFSAMDALQASDGLLVIGSSLMVFSGFRFCRQAHQWGKPIATLNLGRTRADPIANLKLNARITETLTQALNRL